LEELDQSMPHDVCSAHLAAEGISSCHGLSVLVELRQEIVRDADSYLRGALF
jgi:hypothetical protein